MAAGGFIIVAPVIARRSKYTFVCMGSGPLVNAISLVYVLRSLSPSSRGREFGDLTCWRLRYDREVPDYGGRWNWGSCEV